MNPKPQTMNHKTGLCVGLPLGVCEPVCKGEACEEEWASGFYYCIIQTNTDSWHEKIEIIH